MIAAGAPESGSALGGLFAFFASLFSPPTVLPVRPAPRDPTLLPNIGGTPAPSPPRVGPLTTPQLVELSHSPGVAVVTFLNRQTQGHNFSVALNEAVTKLPVFDPGSPDFVPAGAAQDDHAQTALITNIPVAGPMLGSALGPVSGLANALSPTSQNAAGFSNQQEAYVTNKDGSTNMMNLLAIQGRDGHKAIYNPNAPDGYSNTGGAYGPVGIHGDEMLADAVGRGDL